MRRPVIAKVFIVTALAGACGKESQPPPPPPPESTAESPVEEMYRTKCARCHGIKGAANGLSSDSLHPRPHKYTDPAWQASVTDDEIKEIIVRGGANLGKSPAMPGNPTLKHRPEVLDGLVKLIRSFGKPAAK